MPSFSFLITFGPFSLTTTFLADSLLSARKLRFGKLLLSSGFFGELGFGLPNLGTKPSCSGRVHLVGFGKGVGVESRVSDLKCLAVRALANLDLLSTHTTYLAIFVIRHFRMVSGRSSSAPLLNKFCRISSTSIAPDAQPANVVVYLLPGIQGDF